MTKQNDETARAAFYRQNARILREKAKNYAAEETRSRLERAARGYDRLAESVEQASVPE
jgi:hypothetical protein